MSTSMARGTFIKLFEKFGIQVTSFIVSILLARILDPSDYAVIALASIIINILTVFVSYGFGSAIIQSRLRDEDLFPTAMYYNLLTGFLLMVVTIAIAPMISSFYHNISLISIISTLSLNIILLSANNIYSSILHKHLQFTRIFIVAIISVLVSSLTGILLAISGAGVYSLVFQSLAVNLISLIGNIVAHKHVIWPKRNKTVTSSLLRYSWVVLVVGLIDTMFNEMFVALIGATNSDEELAFYNKGQQIPKLIITNINAAFDSISFPFFSKYQEDKNVIKAMLAKIFFYNYSILTPIVLLILFFSDELIELLLTDKWLGAVYFVKSFALIYLYLPISQTHLQVLKATGKTNIFLNLTIIKVIINLILVIGLGIDDPKNIVTALVIGSIITALINAFIVGRMIDYRLKDQLSDLLGIIMTFIISYLLVGIIRNIFESTMFDLTFSMLVIVLIYSIMMLITRNNHFIYSIKKIHSWYYTFIKGK